MVTKKYERRVPDGVDVTRPSIASVHEVARDIIPGARVVYVDHDPIVVAHNDALLATRDGVITVRADVRDRRSVARQLRK
jgi:hypothetical protein